MAVWRNLESRVLAAVLVVAARRYAEHRVSNGGAKAPHGEAAVTSSLTEGRAWPGRERRDVRAS